MTTPLDLHGGSALIDIVADLARELPPPERLGRLLHSLRRLLPCDAAALLKLREGVLVPLAAEGLSEDTLGRRFVVSEHPRLERILDGDGPVRFRGSDLPDPYDGLIDATAEQLHVHDCLGATLRINGAPWGVLTLDSLQPDRFDGADSETLRNFVRLAEASVRAAEAVGRLSEEAAVERDHRRALRDRLELIGHSRVMQELTQFIDIVARSDLAVLVLGETGTGKELVARRIHSQSLRAERALVHVNCAALPESLAESELFGHTRGAFTGAIADRKGKFELAQGGTLVLDEIGELPLALQAKLLRALQSGEIQRVGSDKLLRVDVRTIAVTNRDLEREVAAGRFRADLFHRLSVFPLRVPPLRDRGNDILELAGRFLEDNQIRLHVHNLRLSAPARAALLAYEWRGNVRELEHVISRAALLASASARSGEGRRIVTVDDTHLGLAPQAPAPLSSSAPATVPPDETLAAATERFQIAWLKQAIAAHDGNLAATARTAGMDRSNFFRLLKRLALR